MDLDFIEIGTSDFDTLLESSINERGISIEPVQVYLNRLPHRKNTIKVCKGISDKCVNDAIIYYIPPHVIEALRLPNWLKGCNSFFEEHLRHSSYEEYVVCDCVDIIRFVDIINEFEVNKLKKLKLDCEGHDLTILDSIYDQYMKRFLTVLPEEIYFECYTGEEKKPPYRRKKELESTVLNFNSLDYVLEKEKGYNYTLRRLL